MTHRADRSRSVRPPGITLVPLLALAVVGCGTVAAAPEVEVLTSDAPIAVSAAIDPAMEADRLADIGNGLIQLARETADPSVLGRAEEAFRRLLEIRPGDIEATVGLGSLALSRHEFADALELGLAAEELAPGSARPLGIAFDALVELGRYDEAGAVIDRMLRARPDLTSFARLSYHHELHGRLDAAIDAMERAVVAGGAAPENTEFARVGLGDLWLLAGDTGRAEHLFTAALANLPGYVPAVRGMARVALAHGDRDSAIAHLEEAVARTPLPDLLVALGEAQEAAGRGDEARASYRLVREIESLNRAAGVAVEPAQALFETEHGDPATAVEMAIGAYERTPSMRAADALAWALHTAGRSAEALPYAREAVRLGSLEPTYHYHLGVIAAAVGDDDLAIAALERSLSAGTWWSALHAPAAELLLEELS